MKCNISNKDESECEACIIIKKLSERGFPIYCVNLPHQVHMWMNSNDGFELLRKEFSISSEKLKKINISKTKATPIHQFHRPMDGDRQRTILNQRINNQRFLEKGR